MHVATCADDGRITLYGHAQATEPPTSGETTVTAAPSVVGQFHCFGRTFQTF